MAARPYTGISVSIVGLEGVITMLGMLDDPKVKPVLQRATDAGGDAIKPYLVAAAPYPALKAAVWRHRAKRQRPATVLGHHMKNGGFTWKWVNSGTTEHGPKHSSNFLIFTSKRTGQRVSVRRVHGMKAHPFVEPAFARGQSAGMAAVEKVVDDYLNQIAGE
jgi:hypothetical protein